MSAAPDGPAVGCVASLLHSSPRERETQSAPSKTLCPENNGTEALTTTSSLLATSSVKFASSESGLGSVTQKPTTMTIPVPQHGPSVLRTLAMSTTFASIPARLAAHPEEARTLGNLNETCLHWSCFHRGPAFAILPIAASYPDACGIVGACGRSPLHIVCAGGGRGTVNALEETVDLVEKLAGYNVNVSCLISVEDGETPLSGLWGVFSRQFEDFLAEVLGKMGVGDGGDGSEEADGEYRSMMRRILTERRENRVRKLREESRVSKPCAVSVPSVQRERPLLPAWASKVSTIAELEAVGSRKRSRSVTPPRADLPDRHVRILLPPSVLPAAAPPVLTLGEPCQCPYKTTSEDPVEMPPSFSSAAEEIDENIRTLIVQIEKMLLLTHAADYALAAHPGAFPAPLAAASAIGGHFIFHPPPAKVPELDGRAYGPYWTDEEWDPIRGALRVRDRLGELGCPESFLCLLVGLFAEPQPLTPKKESPSASTSAPSPSSLPRRRRPAHLHAATASPSISAGIISRILRVAPSAARELCSLKTGAEPRTALHVAVADGQRTWSEGVRVVLEAYPAALSVRDAKSGLFPFMLAATLDEKGDDGPVAMKLGEGKHMVPASGKDLDTEEEKESRELRSLDTVFKLLLECPVLVNCPSSC